MSLRSVRRRELFSMVGAALLAHPHAAAGRETGAVDLARWRTLRIGAGGFIVGIDLAPDGAIIARTDTYGAWIWEVDVKAWRQMVTIGSMPQQDRHEDSDAISWPLDVVFSASEPTRIYMALGGAVYRSDDRGWHWSRTTASFIPSMGEPANAAKVNGRKLAVDPRNADVLLVSTPRGFMRITVDGGKHWADVAGVPQAQAMAGQGMGHLILFDPSSREVHGRTSRVYASAWGEGVFRSDDCGATWVQLVGGPSCIRHAAVTEEGIFFAVGEELGGSTHIFRFHSVWEDVSPPETARRWHSICASPHRKGRIVIGREDGALCESLTGGIGWGPVIEAGRVRREAQDIPWLAWTDEDWMSNGDIRFDPVTADRLIFAQGVGVWTASFPPGSPSVTWTSQNTNIEQLVTNQCLHAPSPDALPLLASWDRGMWLISNPDAYPDRHLPDRRFAHCWGLDYASSDPTFLAATLSSQQATDKERSCFSWDGGRNWRPFASYPLWRDAHAGKGFIAVSTPRNMVWVAAEGRGMPHFTVDGGKHWTKCELPGPEVQDAFGFGGADFLRRFILCADRVKPHQFYLLHYPGGLFSSSDGGATWELTHQFSAWNDRFHSKLRAVPDKPGHLFHTAGHSNADRHGVFIRSRDGGKSWEEVPHLLEVVDFAFGKAAPESVSPTIFLAGYLHREWGIYRSTDDGQSWTRIGDGFPTGSLDRIAALEGDKHEFGKVYVGLRGSGWVYGVR